MKRAILFSLIAILVTACSKEESIEKANGKGSYYIRFKADGTSFEFKNFVTATKSVVDNQYFVIIQGQNTMSSDVPGLTVLIRDTTEISTKTYGDDGLSSGNSLLFKSKDSISHSSFFTTNPNQLQIVVTAIDSISISGTFSGYVADQNANNKPITEGEFFARFQ